MNFHDVRFPTSLSFGSVGGPERKTDVVTLANGFEERNTPWAHSRRRYDAGVGLRSLDDIEALIAFFEARRGPLFGFRWKDWSDYKSSFASQSIDVTDQSIGTGDGTTLNFQISKTYTSGAFSYTRPICKPVAGTLRAAFDGAELTLGSDFTLDTDTGQITFASPPAPGVAITAGYEFDVPVRFETDQIQTSMASFEAGEVPNVPIIEVRVI